MATERDPAEVIQAILAEIPPNEYNLLRGELGSILKDTHYAAPEAMNYIWRRIADALTRNLPHNVVNAPAWVKRIVNIVQGKEVMRIE
jgi:hypothetical protein